MGSKKEKKKNIMKVKLHDPKLILLENEYGSTQTDGEEDELEMD